MADIIATPEVDTAAISDFVRRAKDIEIELRKVIVGQHDAVRQVLLALFAGGACTWLEPHQVRKSPLAQAAPAPDSVTLEVFLARFSGDKKANEGLIQAQLNRLKDPKQMAELGFQEGMGFVPFGGMGVDAYRAMSKKDNAPVRAAAARILSMDPDSVTEDALIQSALADKNVIVRQAALDALAERGDAKCIERLLKNFSDSNDAVRYRTAATILRLSVPANKPARPSKK